MGQDKKPFTIGLRLWQKTKEEIDYIKSEGIIYEILLIAAVTVVGVCGIAFLWEVR